MKNKEMIEEMAKEIAKRDCYFYDKCNRKPKHNCISLDTKIRLDSDKNYVTIATWLINAGYRNCKDKVVISKEEYEKLTKELINEQRAKEIAQEYFGIVRKETAEKIYYKAEKKAYFKDGGYYDKDRYYLDMEDLKEIIKSCGVEIKEK